MANEINNYITIKSKNIKVHDAIKNIFDSGENEPNDNLMADIINFIDGKENIAIDSNNVSEILGANWVRAELLNSEDDFIEIHAISPWEPLNLMCENLCNRLMEIDQGIVIENIFEEESYENVGASYYSKEYSDEEFIDMDDWDIDRLSEDDEYKEALDNEIKSLMERHRENHSDEINHT
jgi:hypothetical protein